MSHSNVLRTRLGIVRVEPQSVQTRGGLAVVGVIKQHILELEVAVYDALVVHVLHLRHEAWTGHGHAVDDRSRRCA